MELGYLTDQPERADVDSLPGATVLQFGTNWCGHCARSEPHVAAAMASAPQLRHIKVEDGPGRPLGRSFAVKLWPTLVFLVDGVEVNRLVRPTTQEVVDEALAALR